MWTGDQVALVYKSLLAINACMHVVVLMHSLGSRLTHCAVSVVDEALHMVHFTLQQMAQGGMYDQIGGGFHRYSVDQFWHIPHFEKMLYDNPQLASTYLDAFALTGDQQFARTARGILDYLRRDMTHPQGGIFAAEVCAI